MNMGIIKKLLSRKEAEEQPDCITCTEYNTCIDAKRGWFCNYYEEM